MMRGMTQATITKEQLAELAGRYFLSADHDDVPLKLWIDTAPRLKQSYLRAIWDGAPDVASMVRLAALAEALDERFGTSLVCCVYAEDRDWAEIEAAAKALQQVE